MAFPDENAAGSAGSPIGAGGFLGRRLAEAAGVALALAGLASLGVLAGAYPGEPASGDGLRALLADLTGRPGALLAEQLYNWMGAAAWLIGPLLAVWGWQLAAGKRFERAAHRLAAAPLALGLAAFALAAWRPFPDLPATSFLNGGLLGDLLHGALVPAVGSATGLGRPGIALLAAFLSLLGLFMALGGRADLRRRLAPARDLAGGLLAARRRGQAASGVLASSVVTQGREPRAYAYEGAAARRGKAPEKDGKAGRQALSDMGPARDYRLPPLDLLAERPAGDKQAAASREAMEENGRRLESVLAGFGVKGEVVEMSPGPVVTLYEFEPAPGVKSSQVVGLADDIARSMSATAARVAAIPGRSVLGIEIPNEVREMVPLRELLESGAYTKAKPGLTLALGKDIGGAPVMADLSAMPHLLIAGTTGSGKSVGIGTMIQSLLFRLTPAQCRFIMIDPKMLELTVYDGIPHLLSPVVSDPDEAVAALNWAVREMELRYQVMSDLGVRNIAGYNVRVSKRRKKDAGGDAHAGPLPHIVVVVDEIADLMLTAGKEVEPAVQRIAQMARAAGIHLIMATQRPSADVITGTIKANFPTRISFQVTSKIDSRTVLGEGGAEQLLGKGDMLYMAGGGRVQRVHGAFVSDEEVEAVARFLKDQGAPVYVESVTGGEGLGETPAPSGNGRSRDRRILEQAAALNVMTSTAVQ